MALINLLDWREEARQQRQKEFFTIFGLMLLVAALLVGLGWWIMDQRIESQERNNQYLTKEIRTLDSQIKEIEKIEAQIAELENQMNVIQGLQRSRPEVVRLFDELVRSVPEGIHLHSFERDEKNALVFEGRGETTPRISEFLRKVDSSERIKTGDLKDIRKDQKGVPAQIFVLNGEQVIPGAEKTDQGGSE